jgi:alpha-L-rhamnosidase
LIAAEAATWLGEHFRSTLADVRTALDRYFVAGVNHIVYHGTAYSPPQEPWPGWQFYASVEFNPRNSWWTDFSALNQYVTRVQSFLQSGAPDHDVLVYYPFYDALARASGTRLAHFGTANFPLEGTAFEAAVEILERRGFAYDFISDRQLTSLRVSSGTLVTNGGGSYKTLVMPASRFVPLETFERILELASNGAVVVAFKGLAEDVAGYASLDQRRARLRTMKDAVRFGPPDADGIRTARVGRGTVLRGDDLERVLERAHVSRESLVDLGLQVTRRHYDAGRYYFIVNGGDRDVHGWIPLDDHAPGASIFDPMTGRHGDADVRRSGTGALEVQLAIPKQSSLIVATTTRSGGRRFPTFASAGPSVEIRGPWHVRFVAGGPDRPRDREVDRLQSWTLLDGDDVKRFSGTAVYRATFERPARAAATWLLDLGRAHESARVVLNGRDLGTLIGPTFRLTLEPSQLAAANTLEVHVSNLMANRIAALDKAGVQWRKFYNVNFPARLPANRGPDGLFTAAAWDPLDSGLLGPVTLTPLASPK